MASPSIQAAVDNLIAAIRTELREEFVSLIGGSGEERRNRRGRSARPGGAARKTVVKRRAKGAKRTPEEIEQLSATVLGYIRKNPRQRVEQVAAGLGTTTKELALPISKLLEGKSLKTQGVKRGTTYVAK